MLNRLWKPWFVYRPMRLVQRTSLELFPPTRGYSPINSSWGMPIIADPTRNIGRSILMTGVYDISVSEALARLINSGDTVVDAGANVGYMTALASVAAGPNGKVLAFEPHPELFDVLKQNVDAARKYFDVAHIELYQTALGQESGVAELQLPPEFDSNDGVAKINLAAPMGSDVVTVDIVKLDDILGNQKIDVLKLDVEGFEAHVLLGLDKALTCQRVSHILFEDHHIASSEVVPILQSKGYEIFSLGWSMHGLKIQPVQAGSLATHYEPSNYIASLKPSEVLLRCQSKGWLVLRNDFANLQSRVASAEAAPRSSHSQ